MTTDIKWTKATRKKLHGFRTPHKHDPPEDDDPWLTLCLERAGGDNGTGLEVNGAAEPLVIALAEEMTPDAPAPEEPFDATREYHRAALFFLDQDGSFVDKRVRWADVRALVRFWFERGGVAGLFDVLTHPAVLARHVYTKRNQPTASIKNLDDNPDNPFVLLDKYLDYNPYLWALCAWASELDDDELGSVVDEVRELREELPDDEWPLRFATSFVFRRDPSLGDEDMERFMDAFEPGGRRSGLELLVGSLSSADEALTLLQFKPRTQPGIYAYDWLEAYGKDALPLLQHAQDNDGPGLDEKTLKGALKLASK